MRIAIISLDTRGGIQPYVALALGLQRAGHDLRVVAPSDFMPMLRASGLTAIPLTGSIEAALRGSGGASERGALASIRYVRQQLSQTICQWTREVLAACEGAELIMGGIGGVVVGSAAAERLGVPFIEAHLQPVGAPTRAFPGVLFPGTPGWLGGLGRRVSHTLSELALWTPFQAAVRQARKQVLGLPARAPRASRELPVLYGFSRHVIPRPPDWDPRRHVTGYWNLPAGPAWSPPPALEAFIAAGPRPVCIGFGSMTSADPQAMTDMVLDAVQRAGVRAVLLSGWGALCDVTRPDIFVADEVPHDWLYPRMVAVVHHGGAGTTAAALRAGVPAIVVPFTMDQPFWGSRVAALGVGPKPIARARLTAAALATALREATSDLAMMARAAALGELLRAEDGVAQAVAHVDAFARAAATRT